MPPQGVPIRGEGQTITDFNTIDDDEIEEQEREIRGNATESIKDDIKAVKASLSEQAVVNQARAQINAMQWSSHWKCFLEGGPGFGASCGPEVEQLLGGYLTEYSLDFVNLGMFQSKSWTPPSNYNTVNYKCDTDNIKFLYDNTKWAMMALAPLTTFKDLSGESTDLFLADNPKDEHIVGCGNKKWDKDKQKYFTDRVYGVLAFSAVGNAADKVIVVVGHFPHPEKGSSSDDSSVSKDPREVLKAHMGGKIKHIQKQRGWKNAEILLIADLNNDMGDRDAAFDDKVKIEAAFKKMDVKTVNQIRKAENQIRGHKDEVIKLHNGVALEQSNMGWITQGKMTNEEVWEKLDTGKQLSSATTRKGTCCADKPAMVHDKVVFPYAFDRIMASFGSVETIMPLEDANGAYVVEIYPLFVGAFHMPIIAKIEYQAKDAATQEAA